MKVQNFAELMNYGADMAFVVRDSKYHEHETEFVSSGHAIICEELDLFLPEEVLMEKEVVAFRVNWRKRKLIVTIDA